MTGVRSAEAQEDKSEKEKRKNLYWDEHKVRHNVKMFRQKLKSFVTAGDTLSAPLATQPPALVEN